MSFSFTQGRWLYPYSVHWCSVRFPGPWTRLKRFKVPLVLYKWSPNMFWDWDIVDRSHLRIPSLKKRHKSFKRCCNSVKSQLRFWYFNYLQSSKFPCDIVEHSCSWPSPIASSHSSLCSPSWFQSSQVPSVTPFIFLSHVFCHPPTSLLKSIVSSPVGPFLVLWPLHTLLRLSTHMKIQS